MRRATAALTPDPCSCPNCGKISSFVGICHDCFAGFEATEGGWPAWEEAKQRWRLAYAE